MALNKDILKSGSEKRKLSAVLFADIAGYTAMMQEDEKNALMLINRFKKVIENDTPKYNGRIVQFYGDGCLLTFDSSTDAVDCAIILQQSFGKDPLIPVRIGLHMGEVLFKNNGAFGDGINIASRIESMGIPGSILVSKSIRDQILNKATFLLASLGTFEFKNVKEPIEVFALANEGFVIPDKLELKGKFKVPEKKKLSKLITIGLPLSLLIILAVVLIFKNKKAATTLSDNQRVQPVAVIPFENLTNDSKLDDFGLIAKDWISYGLLESGKVPIIVLDQDKLSKIQDENEIIEAIPTGVGIVIKGRFFTQSDEQIAAVAEIFDVKTKKVLFTLNPVVGIRDSIMIMIDKLKKKVIEYWGENEISTGKKPPIYTAYVQYLNGSRIEQINYAQAKTYYFEALKLDSTFNTPLFALAEIAMNNTEVEFRDSVMSTLQQKENSFTNYEKKNWESLKARVIGNIENK